MLILPTFPIGYKGCYAESGGRTLPYRQPDSDQMTVELCRNMCARKGYVFAGVQFFDECLCGNTLPPVEKPESECNTPCKGDISQMCGGRLRNSVYETGVLLRAECT